MLSGLLSPSHTMLMVLVTSCLQYSNSAINPLLYSFLSDHFRKSFRDTCLGACLATRGSRDQTLTRQRDLTFTTRRTRRGPMFTAVLQVSQTNILVSAQYVFCFPQLNFVKQIVPWLFSGEAMMISQIT